jgi:hypothetical protein
VIARHVRTGETIHADDTPVPVLDPGRGKTKTGRLWVAVRDERPWGSGVPPAVFYRYARDRKAEQAGTLLKDCRGYLHADGYSGFRNLYESALLTGPPQLIEVACWAHARRKIYEVHAATSSPAAQELLERIGKLFAIEADIRGKTPDERLAIRSEYAAPLLAELKTAFESTLAQISGKSALAQVLRYALSRWDAQNIPPVFHTTPSGCSRTTSAVCFSGAFRRLHAAALWSSFAAPFSLALGLLPVLPSRLWQLAVFVAVSSHQVRALSRTKSARGVNRSILGS